MTNEPAGVTIRTILRDLAESRSLDLDSWPAPRVSIGGSPFRIRRRPDSRCRVSTHTCAKDACWSSARARSGISRASTTTRGSSAALSAFAYALPCVLVTDGFDPPAEVPIEADRAQVPLLRTRAATPERCRGSPPSSIPICSARGHHPRRAAGHPRARRARRGGERHRQERVRARSRRARPPPCRRRRRRARCRAQSFVIGTCPELTRHHMEIRGLGMINVQDLFGVASTRTSKRVELVVQLERWEPGREYDRLGVDDNFYETARHPHPDGKDAGRARPERRDPRRGRGSQPVAASRAGTTPPAGSSSASTAGSSSRRSMLMRTSSRERILSGRRRMWSRFRNRGLRVPARGD